MSNYGSLVSFFTRMYNPGMNLTHMIEGIFQEIDENYIQANEVDTSPTNATIQHKEENMKAREKITDIIPYGLFKVAEVYIIPEFDKNNYRTGRLKTQIVLFPDERLGYTLTRRSVVLPGDLVFIFFRKVDGKFIPFRCHKVQMGDNNEVNIDNRNILEWSRV